MRRELTYGSFKVLGQTSNIPTSEQAYNQAAAYINPNLFDVNKVMDNSIVKTGLDLLDQAGAIEQTLKTDKVKIASGVIKTAIDFISSILLFIPGVGWIVGGVLEVLNWIGLDQWAAEFVNYLEKQIWGAAHPDWEQRAGFLQTHRGYPLQQLMDLGYHPKTYQSEIPKFGLYLYKFYPDQIYDVGALAALQSNPLWPLYAFEAANLENAMPKQYGALKNPPILDTRFEFAAAIYTNGLPFIHKAIDKVIPFFPPGLYNQDVIGKIYAGGTIQALSRDISNIGQGAIPFYDKDITSFLNGEIGLGAIDLWAGILPGHKGIGDTWVKFVVLMGKLKNNGLVPKDLSSFEAVYLKNPSAKNPMPFDTRRKVIMDLLHGTYKPYSIYDISHIDVILTTFYGNWRNTLTMKEKRLVYSSLRPSTQTSTGLWLGLGALAFLGLKSKKGGKREI